MKPTEVRSALAALSLTQGKAAALLGSGIRSVARWCSEGVSDPPTVALLRLLATHPELVGDYADYTAILHSEKTTGLM